MRAERQYNCTLLYRDERQRNPPKGGPPQDPEGGGLPPDLPSGPFTAWTPFPPFGNFNFVTHVHVSMKIERNLTSASRQINSRFLFPISDKVSFIPRHLNCLYSDASFTGLAIGSDVKFCILV